MTTIITIAYIAYITFITFTTFTMCCAIATMVVPYDKLPDWVDTYMDKVGHFIMR